MSKSAVVDNLWVVPSGNQQRYAASLGQIDWQDLYERHDGYLLFEDVKEQWRNVIQPDYVLIDSRTGHTDTCGICTRQLPDAVTLLFFPNEQNLRGLAKVVRDIRSEAATEQKRQIETHFVMSNVPDLDDEDDILRRMLARFKDDLGIDAEPRFERVVELDEADADNDPGANYLQCMAVAHWATGRCDSALEFASRAKRKAEFARRPNFSCWRYRTVSAHELIEDMDSVMALIQGDKSMVPQFLAAAEGSQA